MGAEEGAEGPPPPRADPPCGTALEPRAPGPGAGRPDPAGLPGAAPDFRGALPFVA